MDSNDSFTAVTATPNHFCDAVLVPQQISHERERERQRGKTIDLHKWEGNTEQIVVVSNIQFVCLFVF